VLRAVGQADQDKEGRFRKSTQVGHILGHLLYLLDISLHDVALHDRALHRIVSGERGDIKAKAPDVFLISL
jgi:hypothetical protein